MQGITINSTKTIPRKRATKQLITLKKSSPPAGTIGFPSAATPTRHLFKTLTLIHIGDDSRPFPIHLEILLSVSPFFTAAFNPAYTFLESQPGNHLCLPEACPADFEYFIQWLYTRTLTHEDLTGAHPAYFRLIRLWRLVDVLQVTGCKNAIIDEIASVADRTNSCPTPDDTVNIWDDETGCDGLKDLVGDLFVWKKTDRLVETHADPWDEAFLRDVVVKLKREKVLGAGAPWRDGRRRCERYHIHDEWAPRAGCVEGLKIEE